MRFSRLTLLAALAAEADAGVAMIRFTNYGRKVVRIGGAGLHDDRMRTTTCGRVPSDRGEATFHEREGMTAKQKRFDRSQDDVHNFHIILP
jgi:hypothetical protein